MGTPRTSERLRLGESSVTTWSVEGGGAARKTNLYTRHEWEVALAVHRSGVLRVQVSEEETAYQLRGWGGEQRGTGDPGGP